MSVITIREYHPESGALLGNVSVLNFGKVSKSMHSNVKVIDIVFTEITTVDNIKIGLISSGGLTVSRDGTLTGGYFGVDSSAVFDASKSASSLEDHFLGLNTSHTSSDANNVAVGSRAADGSVSDYIYLDIELPSSATATISGAWEVFFDYN